MHDEAVRGVVRRDGDGHAVAGDYLDVKTPEASTDAGGKLAPLLALNAELTAGQGFGDHALELDQIVLRHVAGSGWV